MFYSQISSTDREVAIKTHRTRVLLAVDSAYYAQMLAQCAVYDAPDLELVFFTDEEGHPLTPGDTPELLTTIADCEPDVLVHATGELEPNTNVYGWIFDQYPFLSVVHINREGRIRRVYQTIAQSDFDGPAKDSSPRSDIRRLLDAIRECTGDDRYPVMTALEQATGAECVKP
jgi:hypothetical protein